MKKRITALGEIISMKPGKQLTKITVKNNYSKSITDVFVPKFIYKNIIEAQKAGAKEFCITYYKKYFNSDNYFVEVKLDIISSIHVVKNLSMSYSYIDGTRKLVEEHTAQNSENN